VVDLGDALGHGGFGGGCLTVRCRRSPATHSTGTKMPPDASAMASASALALASDEQQRGHAPSGTWRSNPFQPSLLIRAAGQTTEPAATPTADARYADTRRSAQRSRPPCSRHRPTPDDPNEPADKETAPRSCGSTRHAATTRPGAR